MTPLAAALSYIKRGWRVIPIPPGHKHPKGFDAWQDIATTDQSRVTRWWKAHTDHGVGVVCGWMPDQIRCLFVLDVDIAGDKSGDESLRDLELAHGALPATYEVVTGSGGRHLYFYSPVEIRNDAGKRLGQNLDIRGEGGFVVAPPTIHPTTGTHYEIEASSPDHPADAPPWLIDILTAVDVRPDRTPAPATGDRPGDHWAAETTWDQLLTVDGWTLHHIDRDGEEHWTRPGKERRDGTSATVGYQGSDVLKVFTSSVPLLEVEQTYTKLGYLAATRFGGDFAATARHLAGEGYGRSAPDSDQVWDDPEQRHPLSNELIDWATFWDSDDGSEDWVLAPLFARGRGHAVFAGAKTGKSWTVLAGVAALACGKPFIGYHNTPTSVLYVDYEMTDADIRDRLTSFGYGPEDDMSRLHYALLVSLPPLDTAKGGLALVEATMAVQAEMVVIDTTSRAIEGEENSADTYKAFYRHTGALLKREGIALVRIDHSGKDATKGQRGSSAKNDDVDVVWQVARTDDGQLWTATHRRMGWVPTSVSIHVDEDEEEGTFRFGGGGQTWPAGTRACADDMDRLGVPLDTSTREARKVLKAAGVGRQNKVVVAAVKYRRDTQFAPGSAPGSDPADTSGYHSGYHSQKLNDDNGYHPGYRSVAPSPGKGGSTRYTEGVAVLPSPQPDPSDEDEDWL